MKNSVYSVNDWTQRVFILGKVNHLQQVILQTPSETDSPYEALALAYQRLTDKQKIAFSLAGGIPSLFHYQQHMRTGTDTGQLPVLC